MAVASLILVVGRYLITKHYDHRVCYGNLSVGFLIIEFIISYEAKRNEVWCMCKLCVVICEAKGFIYRHFAVLFWFNF